MKFSFTTKISFDGPRNVLLLNSTQCQWVEILKKIPAIYRRTK